MDLPVGMAGHSEVRAECDAIIADDAQVTKFKDGMDRIP